jgi:hypothetical protein
MQRECPAVSAVTYLRRQVQQVVVGNQNWSTSIFGVTPEYQTVRDWPLAAGRFLTKQEDESGAAVAVLGQTVVENLFGPGQNPLDQVVRINNVPFRVVGLLTPKGQSTQGADQDDAVLIPFTTAERKVMGAVMLGTVGSIMVSAVSPELIPEAQRQITSLLRERHRLKSTQDNDFQIRNLADVAAHRAEYQPEYEHPAGECGVGVPGGRGHWDHEHHARVRDGTHARDRHSHGRGRQAPAYFDAISAGGGGPEHPRGDLWGHPRCRGVAGGLRARRVADDRAA